MVGLAWFRSSFRMPLASVLPGTVFTWFWPKSKAMQTTLIGRHTFGIIVFMWRWFTEFPSLFLKCRGLSATCLTLMLLNRQILIDIWPAGVSNNTGRLQHRVSERLSIGLVLADVSRFNFFFGYFFLEVTSLSSSSHGHCGRLRQFEVRWLNVWMKGSRSGPKVIPSPSGFEWRWRFYFQILVHSKAIVSIFCLHTTFLFWVRILGDIFSGKCVSYCSTFLCFTSMTQGRRTCYWLQCHWYSARPAPLTSLWLIHSGTFFLREQRDRVLFEHRYELCCDYVDNWHSERFVAGEEINLPLLHLIKQIDHKVIVW